MRELKRIRLGNYLLGVRIEKLNHSIVFRGLVSHVADTAGVLNKFSNTDRMCLFLDFDDKVPLATIITEVIPDLVADYLDYILIETSENHHNIICPNLLTKDRLDYLMKKYLKYMDYRFNYVYGRDGYNAMRIIPKIVDGKTYRPIKVIGQGFNDYNPKMHRGLISYLHHHLGTMLSSNVDKSTEYDLIIREYETINW